MRVVLDTNVLIAALGFQGRATKKIWDLVEEGAFKACVSPFIIEELKRNLVKKCELPPADAEEIADYVKGFAFLIDPKLRISEVREKDSDNRILECAVEAGADILVTGDLKHLRPLNVFQGIEILTPREFLNRRFPSV